MAETGWPLIPRELLPAPIAAARRPKRTPVHIDGIRQLSIFGAETTDPSPADLAGLLAGPGRIGRMGGTARVSVTVDAAWRVHVLVSELVARGLVVSWLPLEQEITSLDVRDTDVPKSSDTPGGHPEPTAFDGPQAAGPPGTIPDADEDFDDGSRPGSRRSRDAGNNSRSSSRHSGEAGNDSRSRGRRSGDAGEGRRVPGRATGAAGDRRRPSDQHLDPAYEGAFADDSDFGDGDDFGIDSDFGDFGDESDFGGDRGAGGGRGGAGDDDAGSRARGRGASGGDVGDSRQARGQLSDAGDSHRAPGRPSGADDGDDAGRSMRGAGELAVGAGGEVADPGGGDLGRGEGDGDARDRPGGAAAFFEVRTAYSSRLSGLARAWPPPPDRLFLSGPRLRLWVAAGGEPRPGGYALRLDPLEDPQIAESALVRAGLAGTVSDQGLHYLIFGKKRLRRLAELVGERPAAAPAELWPGGAAA